MAAFLKTFRAYHSRCYGRQKLLLILDGIDELTPGDTDLLNFAPDPALLDTGTYVLVTYSPDRRKPPFSGILWKTSPSLSAKPSSGRRKQGAFEEGRAGERPDRRQTAHSG